jgi:hypothetical protein
LGLSRIPPPCLLLCMEYSRKVLPTPSTLSNPSYTSRPTDTFFSSSQKRCDLMKTTPAAHAVSALNVVAAGLLGPAFQSQTIYDFMSKHTMVFTNVPGPAKQIKLFGGKPVRDMTFAVSNLINQVSVMSYAGQMGFSLVVDPNKTPDAHLVGTYFGEELRALMGADGERLGTK